MRHFPRYPRRPHHSGQARIVLFGRHTYLGLHGSPASWAEYQRLLGEWRAGRLAPAPAPPPAAARPRTVADLVARYLLHREEEFAGAAENGNIDLALRPLVRLLGGLPWGDVTRKGLRAALVQAAAGAWLTDAERAARALGRQKVVWSRPHANRCLARWKAVFAWAAGDGELVPAGTFAGLATVKGLREGEAAEAAAVVPATEAAIAAALPRLGRVARALVECLLWTGARPGELMRLTPADLDRSGEVELGKGYRAKLGHGVWAYQPKKHKTAWRGHRRVILFSPEAQRVLAPLLDGRPEGQPVFSPREASRKRPGTRGYPAARYTHNALNHALARACRRAGVPPFCPYQLRHAAGVRLATAFSPEVARIVLGHDDLRTTQIYIDLGRAAAALGGAG